MANHQQTTDPLIDNDLRCELDRLFYQSDGNSHENILNQFDIDSHYYETADMNLADSDGVIGSDVPWLECPACNALTWVITVTE